MRFRADRSWQPAALTVTALAVLLPAPAADAQSYLQPTDTAQETYVIDSNGTTLYRNGVKVCRFNCASVATPVYHQAPAPAPATRPPVMPDRPVAGNHYPIRPAPAVASQIYPVNPVPVRVQSPARTFAQTTSPVAPTAPAPIQPAPQKSGGLTKEQKALLLNAGAALAITTYGIWRWDYLQTSFKVDSEGWFGRTTKHGGADKLGHFWTAYTLSHLFSYVYRSWDFDQEQANSLGALSSLGMQTFMEFGDAYSGDYGFSYEDALMNVAGAVTGYVFGKYPELARKIDFRFEYVPSSFSSLTHDFVTNYDNQRYLVALKLDGFDMFHDSNLSYLELQAGYYTRGYEDWHPGDPDTRRRYLYFGVGLNVSKLLQKFVNVGIFNYVQVPYTSVGVRKGLD